MIDDDLLNMRKYPPCMFMDMYGNGNRAWDQLDHRNINDVIFRVKYIRADLVVEMVDEVRKPPADIQDYKNTRGILKEYL